MLRNAKTLERHELLARDGTIGHVRDLYFDDQQWNLRYFVVDAGSWLLSRKVLISPLAVGVPDWEKKVLPVSLSKQQVKNSPGIDTDKPVSRQHEATLSDCYGWPPARKSRNCRATSASTSCRSTSTSKWLALLPSGSCHSSGSTWSSVAFARKSTRRCATSPGSRPKAARRPSTISAALSELAPRRTSAVRTRLGPYR